MTPKAQSIHTHTHTLLPQSLKLLLCKQHCHVNENKRQSLERFFAHHISDQGTVSKMPAEHLKLNKERNNPITNCIKYLNRPFTKEDIQMVNSAINKISISLFIREMKIKNTSDTTKMPRTKNNAQYQMIMRMWNKWNFHAWLVEMQNVTALQKSV